MNALPNLFMMTFVVIKSKSRDDPPRYKEGNDSPEWIPILDQIHKQSMEQLSITEFLRLEFFLDYM
jgi:hypothetical protein